MHVELFFILRNSNNYSHRDCFSSVLIVIFVPIIRFDACAERHYHIPVVSRVAFVFDLWELMSKLSQKFITENNELVLD